MTTQIDPEDGSLVEREGVDAGSARSTTEGAEQAQGHDGDDGHDGGRAGDADAGPVTQPAQVWADSSGGVVDPAAGYESESGQDEGSIE